MLIIGVDTGGTFTDFVVNDNGRITTFKILSNPKNPEKPIIQGLKPYLERDFILIHGTTVATNAFLEDKKAESGLIITKGFGDILRIGRQNRVNLFSLKPEKPQQLIKKRNVFEISERVLSNGEVLKGVNKKELKTIVDKIEKRGLKTIAVLFLHSYKNNRNEKYVKSYLKNKGDFFITLSSEIFPEYREYERGIITVLNASLMPVISDYIERLKTGINKNKLFIMQSNGGVLSNNSIKKEPIRTLLSGPSGGLLAAKRIAEKIGEKNLITLDMGGTSTDVSVIKNSSLILSKERVMNDLKIKIPMLDIETVGAGGGSIARVDRAGALLVGPQSAGAFPGPACYGNSELPTITDAFVVMNVISDEYFLGGNMKIYPERSFKAIQKIAEKINKDVYQTAEGIINISISSIERALRSITVEKGDDPRYFTLLPFGGAGGLVSCILAEKLDIKKIVIPDYQGVFSAYGMIFSKYSKEFSKSILKGYEKDIYNLLEKDFNELELLGIDALEREGIKEHEFKRFVDMRYKGQSYELTIELSNDFIKEFHYEHEKLYSYRKDDKDIEIVNIRLIASGKIFNIMEKKREEKKNEFKLIKSKVFFNGKFRNFNVYKRTDINSKSKLITPAIILSEFSTIFIPFKYKIRIDNNHNIILEKN